MAILKKPSNTLLLWQTMSPFPIMSSPKPRENGPTSLCAILGNKSNFYRKSEHGISRQRLSMMKVPVRVQYPHIRNPSGVERKMSATQVYKPGSSTQSVMMIIYVEIVPCFRVPSWSREKHQALIVFLLVGFLKFILEWHLSQSLKQDVCLELDRVKSEPLK